MSILSKIEDFRYRAAKALVPCRNSDSIPVFHPSRGYFFAPFYTVARAFKLPDITQSEPFGGLAREVVGSRRTYLYYERLYTLFNGIQNAIRLGADPCEVAEVGVFRGGGSRFLARSLTVLGAKSPRLFCFDTFEGHAEMDISKSNDRTDKHDRKTFSATSLENVREYLSDIPFISLHKGRFEETCGELADKKLAFVHLDVDLYLPTVQALEFLEPRMLPGAMIVVDDFRFTTCPGIEQAITEFLASPRTLTGVPLLGGQYVLVKSR